MHKHVFAAQHPSAHAAWAGQYALHMLLVRAGIQTEGSLFFYIEDVLDEGAYVAQVGQHALYTLPVRAVQKEAFFYTNMCLLREQMWCGQAHAPCGRHM